LTRSMGDHMTPPHRGPGARPQCVTTHACIKPVNNTRPRDERLTVGKPGAIWRCNCRPPVFGILKPARQNCHGTGRNALHPQRTLASGVAPNRLGSGKGVGGPRGFRLQVRLRGLHTAVYGVSAMRARSAEHHGRMRRERKWLSSPPTMVPARARCGLRAA